MRKALEQASDVLPYNEHVWHLQDAVVRGDQHLQSPTVGLYMIWIKDAGGQVSCGLDPSHLWKENGCKPVQLKRWYVLDMKHISYNHKPHTPYHRTPS